MPHHHPYDCAIKRLPGTVPPKHRLYSLSTPERKAMDKYLQGLLATSFILPILLPSHPLGVHFFTILDFHNDHHLVQIWEGHEWKTAFNTSSRCYVYLVMPFGLTDAFQSLVNYIVHYMLNISLYLDNI